MIEYAYENCVTFYKTRELFGGLSNMAGGYPITLGPYTIRTTEHLYQMLRFPDHPDLQHKILNIASPMAAKMAAHGNLDLSRTDWNEIKPDVMMWCLELKLLHNHEKFRQILLATEHRDIVEASYKDNYWGAKPIHHGSEPPKILRGWNVQGRLLWMLRRRIEINLPINLRTAVIDIPNFRLWGDDAMALALCGH